MKQLIEDQVPRSKTTNDYQKKYVRLLEVLRELGSVAVGFSGGIDSTLVLKTAIDELSTENVIALTANSPIFPKPELEDAHSIALSMNVRHRFVDTFEYSLDTFIENTPERCYACKRSFYSSFKESAAEIGSFTVVDGTNDDDMNDDRPWLRILDELGIRSPLAEVGLKKSEIIEISRDLGLPVTKPTYYCLASRFVWGNPVDFKRMINLYEIENWLEEEEVDDSFIYHHSADLARIRILKPHNGLIACIDIREELISRLKRLGYKFVTLDLES